MKSEPVEKPIYLNVAEIPNRRVGCAHQFALNLTIEGGHSPPYNKNIGFNRE
ncbi:hypothetical protein D1AOALGA4SA_482 [Olavius algarvensis Delta 1 endosymbiont]|nr:hypothetical protein D1AOALGA4SA_482 [Olavius algarvensis Delta 1 endosymbiont]